MKSVPPRNARAAQPTAGIQPVFEARERSDDGAMALRFFDLLNFGCWNVMRERWRERRKMLKDILGEHWLPRIGLVPVTGDAAHLYDTWVGIGGKRIVLKEPGSLYRPGERSRNALR